ncbi:nuclear distribution protein nudE homolog isoform X1 [Drosophila ananassae]|uniref:nuclear distribution protein nudE homolog isoform X1 n=1 Tax=Drosophila ananassae TaxID=7217 RepID=UPI0013A5E9EA|nr:nuclear distribution protein nudE homolog isoform X1 [Drosophila ananassae]
MDSPPMFNSVEDECRYWKERSKQYHKEWTDVKQEYDEFVEQSREMEIEMDATLDQKQSIIKDLTAKLTKFERENESLKLKMDSHGIEMSNMEKQLDAVKKDRDSMKVYLRQLEQKNDDLERAHRILNESIENFEKMLDVAYEKNALLELEVDEKGVLQEKLQRLMDETRDLKQELNVKSRYTPAANGTSNSVAATNSINSSMNSSASLPNGIVANGDLTNHDNMMASKATSVNALNGSLVNRNEYNQQHSLKNPENLINGNSMNASSRTTALNIVADMLRKLNWDKALLCPECEKFRCICERPATLQPTTAPPPSASDSSLFRRAFGGSSSSVANSGTSSSQQSQTSTTPVSESSLGGSFASLNAGSNIFKRFAERIRNSPDAGMPL